MKNRIEYFDIAKGIGMLAIIAGHMGVSQVNGFVYTFHVPLFFLISGYFFRDRENFVKVRAKQLLTPYVITAAVITLFMTLKQVLKFFLGRTELLQVGKTFCKYVLISLYGNGSGRNHILGFDIPVIGAIWFLLALFWGLIMLRAILRIKNQIWQALIAIALLICGAITADYIWLPFSIQAGMVSVVFLLAGKWIADSWGIQKVIENKKYILCCSAVWVAAIYFSYHNDFMSTVRADFPNYILDAGGVLPAV